MAVQYLGDNPINSGVSLGQADTSLVSLYGVAPVARRTSTQLATSLISASSYASIASNNAAITLELTNILLALGAMKTA